MLAAALLVLVLVMVAAFVARLAVEIVRVRRISTPAALLHYAAAHPGRAALVALRADAAGDAEIITLEPDALCPLASTMKVLVLAAYARAVAGDALSADERVPLSEVERYWLPGSDGDAHPQALAALRGRGAVDGDPPTLTLDELAEAMITFSDNAAADWLMERLGRDALDAEVDAITALGGGVVPHDPLVPVAGLFLSSYNHELRTRGRRRLNELLVLDRTAYTEECERWAAKLRDDGWRAAELRWRRTHRQGVGAQLAAARLAPRGTARQYAALMAAVFAGGYPTPAANALMRRHLEWPLRLPGNAERFAALGVKGGSLAGVQTGAYYLRKQPLDGIEQPDATLALFLHDLPAPLWGSLHRGGLAQTLAMWLLTDADFFATARAQLAHVSGERTPPA